MSGFVSESVCVSTILLLLLLHFVLLLQVNVGRLHSDDGFVQETEGFLHMFGLHLKEMEKGKGQNFASSNSLGVITLLNTVT